MGYSAHITEDNGKLKIFVPRTGFNDDSYNIFYRTNTNYEIDIKTMKLTSNNSNGKLDSSYRTVKYEKDNVEYEACWTSKDISGVYISATDKKTGKNIFTTYKKYSCEEKPDLTEPDLDISVGQKNILTVGTISKKDISQNLYVIVTDKKTGKSKLKWLTKLDENSDKKSVLYASVEKVTDNCFAVFYTLGVWSPKTDNYKSQYYCMYIDNEGKILKTRNYKSQYYGDYKTIKNGYFYSVSEYKVSKEVYLTGKNGEKYGPFKDYDRKMQLVKIPVYVKQ
ncbi:MAG: hypothetical protein IJ740_00765 [Ruminococcus sp.]|nr:hypothetical protein [Ruminococcus sp.]